MRPRATTRNHGELGELGLAAAVAHEVRRVLTPAAAYAELALEAGGLPPDAERALQAILAASHEANDVLRALTSHRPDVGTADVGEVLKRQAGIRIQTPSHFFVAMSAPKLAIVLSNLITNAKRALRGNGAVTVHVEGSTGNSVSIHIEDSGVGMSPDQIECVTRPFVSFSASSGMGLAICRYLVEEAGGSLRIRSANGQGTCVTVELPAAVDRASAKAA